MKLSGPSSLLGKGRMVAGKRTAKGKAAGAVAGGPANSAAAGGQANSDALVLDGGKRMRLRRASPQDISDEHAGHDNALAGWTDGGWRFIALVEGMRLTARASGLEHCYRAGTWEIGLLRAEQLVIGGAKVVGNRGVAILDPTGGTTNDSIARTCLGQILSALRLHGLIQT